jgi:signal transduction histidine kinase
MNATDGGGLGLVIAHGLVLAQGGRVWAANRPGGGARVSFTLPSVG